MGGKSNGCFTLDGNGHAVFKGCVSLDNNGGFSMVKHQFETIEVSGFTKVSLRLKGDGKTYQFRIKTSNSDYYSYVSSFETSGYWETIEIPFKKMYPAFRGKKLNISNFPGELMAHIAFLIGNKRVESFILKIDSIVLK